MSLEFWLDHVQPHLGPLLLHTFPEPLYWKETLGGGSILRCQIPSLGEFDCFWRWRDLEAVLLAQSHLYLDHKGNVIESRKHSAHWEDDQGALICTDSLWREVNYAASVFEYSKQLIIRVLGRDLGFLAAGFLGHWPWPPTTNFCVHENCIMQAV